MEDTAAPGTSAAQHDPAAEPAPVPGQAPTDNAAAATPPVLSVRDLFVTFRSRHGRGRARAVDGVDLDIAPGEIVALVGESGCGKSTLARALTGLVVPTAGQVLHDGAPVSYKSRALKAYRRGVQLVLQDPAGALNPRRTVYEAVAEGLRIHGKSALGGFPDEKAKVADALSRAGLRPPERFLALHPHQLSGGQRQRVVIAGALVLDPQVLVADEPVASLDASVRGEILKLMLDLRAGTGLSALVVTHDLGLAWNIADRVAVMYLGRIVETGTVEEVLTAPKHPYTKALLSVVAESGQDPVILTGETPDSAAIPAGCRFHPRCPLVASGQAEQLGVAERCRTEDPKPLPATGRHAACHAADLLGVAAPDALNVPNALDAPHTPHAPHAPHAPQNAPTPSDDEGAP
ncbi:oligopeptide/dipeptide ABC transporter ATP-binding protein [Catenulispora sp. GP43]|uniref:ABC transporter ATP-binding protein n=1 Tax=Catenulispora sp. GP43 TaxID=3156263 RepID=UPI00351724C0